MFAEGGVQCRLASGTGLAYAYSLTLSRGMGEMGESGVLGGIRGKRGRGELKEGESWG
jgi:hypothetical protein